VERLCFLNQCVLDFSNFLGHLQAVDLAELVESHPLLLAEIFVIEQESYVVAASYLAVFHILLLLHVPESQACGGDDWLHVVALWGLAQRLELHHGLWFLQLLSSHLE
jgi:hypothetical protein